MLDKEETLRQNAIAQGGQHWGLLGDAVSDEEFKKLLNDQELNIFNRALDNPGTLSNYSQYFADILAKYIAWVVYTQGNVPELKNKISDYIKKYEELENKIRESEQELKTIQESAKYISGATALVEYSKAFCEAADKHGVNAQREFKNYVLSLLGFVSIVALAFFFSVAEFPIIRSLLAEDVHAVPLNTGVLALKAFLLLFAYQITQFFRKNYGAEKHLQEVYQHRSDVLQSLHAVYETLKDNPEERAKILSAGALFAYERGETGYITTKEGAGSGDSFLESIFGKVLNR